MAASDMLYDLAQRAKVAEDRVSQAKTRNRDQLQAEVDKARETADAHAARLQESASGAGEKMSQWWAEVQQNWRSHVAKVSSDIEGRKQEHDASRAARKADHAEDDAIAAVDFASAALDEAEYAVLDARLARMEADDLAAASGGSA
jgi:uncharacterized membrane-anchored protein YhcB (DUF1043 family)